MGEGKNIEIFSNISEVVLDTQVFSQYGKLNFVPNTVL